MSSFESLSDDDKLLYAHALERKGRDLVELLLRRRRVAGELAPLLAPADQEAVLAKIHGGFDEKIREAHAEAVVAEARPKTDPDEVKPSPVSA